MRPTILAGLDSSTQSATACAFDLRGRLLARVAVPQPFSTDGNDRAEQDPRAWTSGALSALRGLSRLVPAASIGALGVSFQRETFALSGRDGRFVSPGILWLDMRASGEAEAMARGRGDREFRRLTGKSLDGTCAAPRLEWLAGHEPGTLRKAACLVDVGSALSMALAGRYATCVSGIDTCGLVSLQRREWIPGLVPRKARHLGLPALVEPGTVLGPLLPETARATGLPSGLPVVLAGGDGQVFALGAGADRPGRVSVGLGTSVVAGLVSSRPAVSPAFRTLLLQQGSYLLEGVLQSGTWLLRWFVSSFGRQGPGREEAWDALAAKLPAGSGGLLAVPHWRGARFPDARPAARGVVAGWSASSTPAHFYRALLEGTAFELKYLLSAMEAHAPGRPKREVRAGGGGMSSRIWPAILAGVLDRPLVPAAREATALGAAMWAGIGTGLFASPRAAAARMVRNARPARPSAAGRRLYSALYRDWRSIRGQTLTFDISRKG